MAGLVSREELLELPLGVKIPVMPSCKHVFTRANLGEKLHRSSWSFNLGDPYCRLLGTEYNSLHDPHLLEYHNRNRNIRKLKNEGYITSDDKVVCTLKEFNEYRQYLTMLKLEAEKASRREEERILQWLYKLQYAHDLPERIDTSGLIRRLLQPQKPPFRAPPKSANVSQQLVRCKRLKAALERAQKFLQHDLEQKADTLCLTEPVLQRQKPSYPASLNSKKVYRQSRPSRRRQAALASSTTGQT